MMRVFFLFLCLLISVPAFAAESAYTTLDMKECKMLESSENDPNAEIDYFTMRCPGREGYDVIVSGGDLRSWVILQKGGIDVFDSREDVFSNAPGSFPYVGGGKLEWRYSKPKELSALIFRVNGQNPKQVGGKDVSTLLVFRHMAGKFCYLGKGPTNDEARLLADSNKICQPK